jgi:hypothetical protein
MKPKKTKASSEAQKGKSKAKPKSLEIRKETIESLSDDELNAVKGGRALHNTDACTTERKAAFFSVGCHGK